MFRRSRVLAAVGATRLALAGGLAFAGSASASINNGHVVSSNGEAGWFTWSGNRFDEVHADVITHISAEQSPPAGSPTLGNGVALCTTSSATLGDSAQIGEVWNSTENAFDVIWAEGDSEQYVPNTNGNPCTTGGALKVTSRRRLSRFRHLPRCYLRVLSTQTDDIPLGDRVYVQIRQWNTHLQFLAEDLTTGLGDSADNEPGLSGFAHYAQAGPSSTQRTGQRPRPPMRLISHGSAHPPPPQVRVRRRVSTSTPGLVRPQFPPRTVPSSDTPLVVPTGMLLHVAGGLGCFSIDVGTPVGI